MPSCGRDVGNVCSASARGHARRRSAHHDSPRSKPTRAARDLSSILVLARFDAAFHSQDRSARRSRPHPHTASRRVRTSPGFANLRARTHPRATPRRRSGFATARPFGSRREGIPRAGRDGRRAEGGDDGRQGVVRRGRRAPARAALRGGSLPPRRGGARSPSVASPRGRSRVDPPPCPRRPPASSFADPTVALRSFENRMTPRTSAWSACSWASAARDAWT